MRPEIQKRDEKISSLSRKLGAKFVPFQIFSDDKLQYVIGELEKANVPFVEESNAVYVPDYAQKTAATFAAAYQPTKPNSIRDKIRFEIDRLVYCSVNLDHLFKLLRNRGYKIKSGKHIAVKPTFAERFVRFKSLGEAYLPKNLEQRIADRDKFPNAVREKFATANAIEKQFHVTIMDTVVAVKQFRIEPRKLKPKKIYTFQNDVNINYLSEQLCTIGEFNFSSKEQIYAKAEELKRGIDEKTTRLKELSTEIPTLKSDIKQLRFFFSVGANSRRPDTMEQVKTAAAREIADKYGVKSEDDIADLEKRLRSLQSEVNQTKNVLSDEQLKLKRVSDLITAYENIVDGNYIDNLVRVQRECSKTLDNANLVK